MAETLRELVVRLSLESDNFTRNMRTINQQIKEAESTFRLAGAGVQNFDKTLQGAESKLSTLKSKLDMQKAAVDQYAKALKAAEDKLQSNHTIQQKYIAALDSARSKHGTLNQRVDEAKQKYDRLAATLGTTNATTRTAADELDNAKKALAANEQEMKKLEGQVAATTKTLQNNADQVSKLQTGLNNANAALKDTEAQIKATEREISRLSSGWTKAGSALTAFSQKCAGISKELTTVGKGLSTHVTAPLAALGATATKAAISFESAMAGVRKTLPQDAGDEARALQTLSDRIQQLSLETASSAEEIAGVVENAGQLGIKFGANGDTIMDFAKTMIMLGDSTDMAADEAASSAARFFNIMGTGADQYDNYGSAVTELGNRFATTESEIVEMSMRLAGAGKQVGLSEAEILGFATALSSVGIKAQMGGSAFSKALINMELAVATGNKQLQSFADVAGMSSEQFSAAWKRKPAEAFQAFINGLARYSEDEGNSAIAFLQEMGFKEIRLRDTTLRLAASTDLLNRAQNSANQAWRGADLPGQNALVNEANKRYQTMAAKLTQLKNKSLMFARSVGNDLTPTVSSFMEVASGALDKFMDMDDGMRLGIEKFAMFAAAAGPAILVAGKFIGTIGSIAGTAGKFASWMGTITTAAHGAQGGLLALAAGLNPVALGIGAVTAAAAVGGAVLYDYASGAKNLRDETSELNKAAKEWKKESAETFYQGAGLSTFGLTGKDFNTSRTEAQRWVDDVTKLWDNGEKKTGETVTRWTDHFKSLTDDTRTELKAMQEQAKASGNKGLSQQLTKDMRSLDSIDRQVTNLLKKKANGKLTDKEKVKLADLIQQGDAIRIKYQLEPQDAQNVGYEKLRENLEAELHRLQVSGASQDQITDAYGKAAAAAAQGYKAVNDQLDESYRTRYQEIQGIEDESEKQKALNELNKTYTEERKRAAQEYAQILKETYGPVLKEQVDNGTGDKIKQVLTLLNQYKEALKSGDTKAQGDLIGQLNDLNLDEKELTEYAASLTQIKSLMDKGLISEAEMNKLFPDLQPQLESIASVQKALNELSGDENIQGLKTMIGEALPQEVQKIMIGLDMTQAAADWQAFASNPGAVTVQGTIEKLEYEAALANVKPEVQAAITEYTASEEAKNNVPSPQNATAYVAQYLEKAGIKTDNLKPGDITGEITKFYCDATGADYSAVHPVVEAEVNKLKLGSAPEVNDVKIGATATLNKVEASALRTWAAQNSVQANTILRVKDKFNGVEDLFAQENVKFYEGGVEVPVSPEVTAKVTRDTLIVTDADGTIHVQITPEMGTPKAMEEYREAMESKTGQGTFLGGLFDSTNDKVQRVSNLSAELTRLNDAIEKAKANGGTFETEDGGFLGLDDLNNQKVSTMGLLSEAVSSLSDQDLSTVGTGISNLIAALDSGEGTPEQIEKWKSELESLKSLIEILNPGALTPTGTNVSAGIAEGMVGYSFTGDADTVKTNILNTINAALDIHSPAGATKPTGEYVAAGIGQGMKAYDFSVDILAMTDLLRATIEQAIADGDFTGIGAQTSSIIGGVMANTDFSKAGANVASRVKNAVSSKLNRSTLRPTGLNAMKGLEQGIRDGTAGVVSAMESAARKAIEAAKKAFVIESPSHVMRDEVGVMAMRGFGVGVEKETPRQARIIRNAASYLVDQAKAGTAETVNNDNRRTVNNSSTFAVTQNIYGNQTSYAAQQREAVRQFELAARRL